MDISELKLICQKAYCHVCFDPFEALNTACSKDALSAKELSKIFDRQLGEGNVFEAGRKLTFCRLCKSTFHAGCYKPESSFPITVKLQDSPSLTLEYFECNRCTTQDSQNWECGLCGVKKGFMVPMKLTPRQATNPDRMQIETNGSPTKTGHCHVICGLINNGYYQTVRTIELDPALVIPKLERKCHLCDLKFHHGYCKCSDCNLHLHLYCRLSNNIEKIMEDGIRKGDRNSMMLRVVGSPFSQPHGHGHHHTFSPDEKVDKCIAESYESIRKFGLFSDADLHNVFQIAISKKLGNFNAAVDTQYSLEYSCRHHSQNPEENETSRGGHKAKCPNCAEVYDSADRTASSSKPCFKCKTLKRLSKFETKDDFEKYADDLKRLSTASFSVYDRIFLAKLFYDRLVFIMPGGDSRYSFLRGFRLMKKRLPTELASELLDKVLKTFTQVVLARELDGTAPLPFKRAAQNIHAFVDNLKQAQDQLSTDLHGTVTKVIQQLEDAADMLAYVIADGKTFIKITKKLQAICEIKGLKNTAFVNSVNDSLTRTGQFVVNFGEFLDQLLNNESDDPFRFLKIKDFAVETLMTMSDSLDSDPLSVILLSSFLSQYDLLDSHAAIIASVEQYQDKSGRILASAVSNSKFQDKVPNLADLINYHASQSSPDHHPVSPQEAFTINNLNTLSEFKQKAAKIFATVQKSNAKKLSCFSQFLQQNIVMTLSQVHDFLDRHSAFVATETYQKLQNLHKRSVKTSQTFRRSLSDLLHSFGTLSTKPASQLTYMRALTKDYFTVLINNNCFLDEFFVFLERKLNNWTWLSDFVEGKLSRIDKINSILDTSLRQLGPCDSAMPDYQKWQGTFIDGYMAEIYRKAKERRDSILGEFERFRIRVFGAFSSDDDLPKDLLVKEVYDEIEKFSHFPLKGFEREIQYFEGLVVVIEAIKRAVSPNSSVLGWRVTDLISHIVSTDNWTDLFRHHNRFYRYETTVNFLIQIPIRRKEVDTFFYPLLQTVLQQKLETLSAEKVYSVKNIVAFLTLLAHSRDELFRGQLSEYRVFKVFNSLATSLVTLFVTPQNQTYFSFFFPRDVIDKMKELAVRFGNFAGVSLEKLQGGPPSESPQTDTPPNSLESVRWFVKSLSDVLDRAKRFEQTHQMDSLISFLEGCHKKFVSLNVLYILSQGDAQIWEKVANKYNTSVDRLDQHISDVQEINARANSPEIQLTIQNAADLAEVYRAASLLTHKFKTKQAYPDDTSKDPTKNLVRREDLTALKDKMKPHKGVMRAKYDELKKIIQYIDNFEANLTIELDNVVDECHQFVTSGVDPRAQAIVGHESQKSYAELLEQQLLVVGSLDVPKPPALKPIRSKYHDTRGLYYGKSFTSPSIGKQMKQYKIMYELYRILVMPKSINEIYEFLNKNDFSFFDENSKESKIVEILTKFLKFLELIQSDSGLEITPEFVEELGSFRGLLFPGCIEAKSVEESQRLAGLIAIKYLAIDAKQASHTLKSFQHKLAAYAIFRSGLRLTNAVADQLFSQLRAEGHLIQMASKSRQHERFLSQFVTEYYALHTDIISSELETVASNYLTQVERLMNARHRSQESKWLPEGPLSTDVILATFNSPEVTERKKTALKHVCTRSAVTRFALLCQNMGVGHLNPLNFAIQTLLDSSDGQPGYDAMFEAVTSEKEKVVVLTKDTLLFDKSIREKPTDRGLFNLFNDLRLTDQLDASLIFLAQLSIILHIYFCILSETIQLKIKELKLYFSEIKVALQTADKLGLAAELSHQVHTCLQVCWAKADDIINETERYVASLSSLTIDVETVSRYKAIVSTSDMTEGIVEVNSKWVDSQNPWGKHTLVVDNEIRLEEANSLFLNLEDVLVSRFAEEYQAAYDKYESQLESASSDIAAHITPEVAKYRQELVLKIKASEEAAKAKKEAAKIKKDSAKPAERDAHRDKKRRPSVEEIAPEEMVKTPKNRQNGDQKSPPKQAEFFEISEMEFDEESNNPAPYSGAGTLEGILGVRSQWKTFQKAIQQNPRFDIAQNRMGLGVFCKKLETNFRSLAFMFTGLTSEDLEAFLSKHKDINIIIDRYNSQKIVFKELVDLVHNPETRLKTSTKKKKEKTKEKSSLLDDFYQELEQDQDQRERSARTRDANPEPTVAQDGDAQLGASRPELTPEDEDQLLMGMLDTKRVKPTVTQSQPVTTLWRLTSSLLSKVQFIDDRVASADKVTIQDVHFYTTEPAGHLFTFPDFQKSLKFRTSELKKNMAEIQKDYNSRKLNGDNMAAGFVFLPTQKLQNIFYMEFERGLLAGYACAPSMQIFLAHSSMLQPEFFQNLNVYLPESNEKDFSNLFVFFLRKSFNDPQQSNHLLFEKEFESNDSEFAKVRTRKTDINQIQIDYYNAVAKARHFNVQPHIYYKMGQEILNMKEEMYQPVTLEYQRGMPGLDPMRYGRPPGMGAPMYPRQPVYPGTVDPGYGYGYPNPQYPPDPRFAGAHPPLPGYPPRSDMMRGPPQPIFTGYGPQASYPNPSNLPPVMPHHQQDRPQPSWPPQPQPTHPSRIQFEDADAIDRPAPTPTPAAEALDADDIEIKDLITGMSQSELSEFYLEADGDIRESILKILRIERPQDYPQFLRLINN
jgi:hypothetical protein